MSEVQSQVEASKRAQQQAHTAVRNFTAQQNSVRRRMHQLAQEVRGGFGSQCCVAAALA
jgi:hypothetical protein